MIWNKGGKLFLNFATRDNYWIDTRDLCFKIDNTQSSYKLKGNDSLVLHAKLSPEPGKEINRKFVFYGNKYHISTDVSLVDMETIIPVKGYKFNWSDGLRYMEASSVDESSDALAMTSMNKELEDIDASGNDPVEKNATGRIDFSAIKSKYFTVGIIPQPHGSFDGTVNMTGSRTHVENEGVIEKYNIAFLVPYRGGRLDKSFEVYIGPVDYDLVSEYGLGATVNLGWKWLIRPISEFFMLPFFKLIYHFIGNFGISIIIFSIFLKIILYPLSVGQMRSAQKMKLIQPEMNKLREKYKDDNATMQKETMSLYSKYGINPAGGCLPLLLQMPIMYALWSVLRSAIDLRQSYFGLWITDLSQPDILFSLPFSLLGIKHISGLALLMGATMFVQQKMTVTDPRQKSMVYVMPIMFTFMFSNFPAGLNLYYFMFNLLSIANQYYINNFSKKKITLEEMRKSPKKEGWMQKKMREAQEIAHSQGRTVPGQTTQKTLPGQKPFQKKKK